MSGRFDALICIFGSIACVLVVATAARLDPDARGFGTHEQLGMAPCGFMARTGRPCLSCGMTTAFAAAAHGRIGTALDANPYGAALFFATLLAPLWLLDSLRRRASPFRFLDRRGGRRAFLVAGLLLPLNWAWMLLRAAPPS
jgi:hypothetical protein